MALNKGIWDPKLRGTNVKGTHLKSLSLVCRESIGFGDRLGLSEVFRGSGA